MNQQERDWDKKLKIDTIGRDASLEDSNHYPYEPTPYSVLERIANCGYITKDNCVIDYGCGKGRVDFYLSWKTGCHTIGVDFDHDMIKCAQKNLEHCHFPGNTTFVEQGAEEYRVGEHVDRFYFFNPFSVKVVQSVIGRIKESWYECPREMILLFYYPSEEYITYLMSERELEFLEEVDCSDLFEGHNKREHILLFKIE